MTSKLIYGFIALHFCLILVSLPVPGLLSGDATMGGEECMVGPDSDPWVLNGPVCGTPLGRLADSMANMFSGGGSFLGFLKTKVIGGIGIVRTFFEMAIMDYDLLKQSGAIMGFIGLGVRMVGWGIMGAVFISMLGSFRT